MLKFILPAFFLFHISLTQAADRYSSQGSDEPAMMHWSRLSEYMASRGTEKTYLVIEVGQVEAMPLVSQCSYADALKIRILDGGGGSHFFPDIDSFLKWEIPHEAKGAFHEVHIQRGQRGQEDLYSILFAILKPGGKMFDYRVYSQTLNESDTRVRIQSALEYVGFTEICFGLSADTLLPGEQDNDIIFAQKPESRPLSAGIIFSASVDGYAHHQDDAYLVEYLRRSRRVERLAVTPAPTARAQSRISPSNIIHAAFRICRNYLSK